MLPRSIGYGRRVFTPEVTGSIPVGSAKRVWRSGNASSFQVEVLGSNPGTRSIYAVSSNGKTPVSYAVNLGSTPSTATEGKPPELGLTTGETVQRDVA